MLRIYGISCR